MTGRKRFCTNRWRLSNKPVLLTFGALSGTVLFDRERVTERKKVTERERETERVRERDRVCVYVRCGLREV